MTSLCPKLGKMYAQEFKGSCPSHMQEPFGKTLNVSFIGFHPYVSPRSYTFPFGRFGSEFVVTNILAKKFGFIPKFIPAFSLVDYDDQVRKDDTLPLLALALLPHMSY